MRGLSVAITLAWVGSALAASQAEKEAECQFQADLMGAVQTARLERVTKDDVLPRVRAANPDWPAGIDTAIPTLVEYVWSFKRRDLRKIDLAADTRTTCLENWDQIQRLKDSVTN